MIDLPGYQITEQLFNSEDSRIYRAICDEGNQPVVLKILNKKHPTEEELAKFKREFEITKSINAEGVINVYRLEPYKNTLVMVMEDIGGVSLAKLIEYGALELNQFLTLAISISKALGQVHQSKIIHKDICPSNIIFNLETDQIKLIDFGIAVELSRENKEVLSPNVLEGTLSYVSPEQTGRMNRVVDYRSDLYSLGATFYSMLTQQPPFKAKDAVEIVHAHIAKTPVAPHKINASIPLVLSKIVMKLLSKTAEERYQNTIGVVADLKKCLEQITSKGEVELFDVAEQDISDQFHIPQNLYGREIEVNTLMSSFDRVANGTTEMILVAGYSGVGKSVLVHEVHKPIVAKRGYFIAGKFDQFLRNIPYSALIQAFQELTRQLLTESNEQLAIWKQKLLQALGEEGQVVVDVIPEIELVIGPQPTVPRLGPQEAQNRFNLTFQSFIKVLAQKEHPLVVFLDDLQWADTGTLNLLTILLSDQDSHHLLFMGAYRDNEVDHTHPFMLAIDDINRSHAVVHTLKLAPLQQEPLNQLLADTLKTSLIQVKPLGQLVMRKTGGNPFFVNQFLKRLYQDQLIVFDTANNAWVWDVNHIEARDITDNIVELMIEKIQKLPVATQCALNLGACIGNTFELKTLALICGQSLPLLVRDLWPALNDELLVARGDAHKLLKVMDADNTVEFNEPIFFHHDRIQQAAYEIISEGERQAAHLKIGRTLFKNLSTDDIEDALFAIVGQFNDGLNLIDAADEKLELAKLNLRAAKKAKNATAYGPALTYLKCARGLLPSNHWNSQYSLSFELYKELAECEYLVGNLDIAESIFDEALSNASSKYDQGEIYKLKMVLFFVLNKYTESIITGIEALRLFGIELPEHPNDTDINSGVSAAKKAQGKQTLEDAVRLPECTETDVNFAMKILSELGPPTYMSNPNLLVVVFSKMAEMAFTKGITADSSYGFAGYAIVLGGVLGEWKEAHDSGLASLAINDRFNNSPLSGRIHMMFIAFTNHWLRPLDSNFPLIRKGFQECMKVGELRYACYMHLFSFWQRWSKTSGLQDLYDEYSTILSFIDGVKDHNAAGQVQMFLGAIRNLQYRGNSPDSLSYERFDEQSYLDGIEADQYLYGINTYQLMKLVMSFTYENYEDALRFSKASEESLAASIALYNLTEQCLYSFLTQAALYPEAKKEQQKQFEVKMEQQLRQMEIWAENCPENQLHKLQMMQAEMARIQGQMSESLSLYERAISHADKHSFLKDRALANELNARFWLAHKMDRYAKIHMVEAHHLYNLWGAIAKAKQLEKSYPQLLSAVAREPMEGSPLRSKQEVVATSRSEILDVTSVMKASQAISESIVFTDLLKNLMAIVVENAGAQRGILVLEKKEKLFIEAESKVDGEVGTTLNSISLESDAGQALLPSSIVNYVVRTGKTLVLDDACSDDRFSMSPYLLQNPSKSVLCNPIFYQGRMTGMLYLENNLMTGAFTRDRRDLLELLTSQAAISLENARLYEALIEGRNSLEQRVKERTSQLELANQELKSFSYSVSHDLRAPLRRVDGFSEMLAENYADVLGEDGHDCIRRIRRMSGQMGQLIEGMLMLSTASSQELTHETVDLSLLAREIIQDLRVLDLTRNVDVYIEDSLSAVGDSRLLRVVLDNLLNNAWKYTRDKTLGKIEFGSKTIDGRLTYYIRDNGAGFNMEHVDQLFMVFQRLHGVGDFEGTGIGLATVQKVIRRHGGSIWAQSEPEGGATFYFTLGRDVFASLPAKNNIVE